MALRRPKKLAGRQVEEAEGPFLAADEGVAAIGGDGDGPRLAAMPLQRAHFLSGLEVPEARGAVVSSGEGLFLIGRQGDRDHCGRVPTEQQALAVETVLNSADEGLGPPAGFQV